MFHVSHFRLVRLVSELSQVYIDSCTGRSDYKACKICGDGEYSDYGDEFW